MSLASDNYTTALAALITQITALVNTAAAGGQTFVTTLTLYPNQLGFLTNNGYTVTQVNGLYTISWQPPAP